MSDKTHGLAQELDSAVREVRDALQRAGEATRTLDALAQRVDAIAATFDELEGAIRRGRERLSSTAPSMHAPINAPSPAASFVMPVNRPARPTLVVPGPRVPQWGSAEPAHAANGNGAQPLSTSAATRVETPPAPEASIAKPATTSFRLVFESTPGPLDLRAVDNAISEHPSVRDVALLDYDGHRATLKVWIAEPARPADVQRALITSAPEIFPGHTVNVVALEDAA